ncbi:hypothetical protein NFI96_026798, partial [Prochilodus magdalenae]
PRPTQPNETNPGPAKQPVCLATDTAAVAFPVTTVEVYGTSAADLAKVKKLLDDLISEECTSKDVQSTYLANLQEADKEAIVTLSQKNQVQILVASSDKLTVSGKKDDVLDTVLNISTFIQEAKEREAQESEKRRLRETLCWEVAGGESWVPLDSSISYQLELAFHKKQESFTYEEDEEVYTVNFRSLIRQSKRGITWRMKRTPIGDSDTAVAYGEGTYFAKDAWYSCRDLYSNPDESGFKYIYRARVVTGSPCKSRRGMKEPDPLDPNNPQAGLYDCAVNNLENPSIYVVFCDAGAYPDYLIIAKNT